MPGRLIAFIVALVIIITFIGLNLENRSDIAFWFGEKGLIEDVPIFISFFVMYVFGVLSVVPFLIGWRLKQHKKRASEKSKLSGKSPKPGKVSKKPKNESAEEKTVAEAIPDTPPPGDVPAPEAEEKIGKERTGRSRRKKSSDNGTKVKATEKGDADAL